MCVQKYIIDSRQLLFCVGCLILKKVKAGNIKGIMGSFDSFGSDYMLDEDGNYWI